MHPIYPQVAKPLLHTHINENFPFVGRPRYLQLINNFTSLLK